MGATLNSKMSSHLDRLDCVQVLRAVAAIIVLVHHIPLFDNDQGGVDLFFVIGGFIMCYATQRSGDGFLAKRIIRIVPLYWAATIGVFGVTLIAPRLLEITTSDPVQFVKSLAFIPFQKGKKVLPLLNVGWALNCVMFINLLFALSMKLSHRYRAHICSALIVMIVIYGQLTHSKSVPISFWTSPIILEFVFGMVCFCLFAKSTEQRAEQSFDSSKILWALVGGILITCMLVATGVGLSGVERALGLGMLAALSLYVVVMGLSGVRFPKFAVLIGNASYSLYLIHPFVIRPLDKIFHAFDAANRYSYLMASVAIVLCCGLSVLCYKFVEKPITDRLKAKFVGTWDTKRDRYPRQALKGRVGVPLEFLN